VTIDHHCANSGMHVGHIAPPKSWCIWDGVGPL
jgi:hypothetical protein